MGTNDESSPLPSSTPLHLNDLFWTIQGEGQWTGRRALFIRLPFCNYNCPWCDTEYDSYDKVSEADFLTFCQKEPSRFAVITGGEPMAHKDLKRIIMLLKQQGFYIACETNGSLPIPEEIDFPTVSPKRYTQNKFPEFYIHEDAWKRAHEFKYVVDDDFDFTLLDRHRRPDIRHPIRSEESSEEPRLSLTPEFTTMKKQLPRILEYIQKNPQWQLNLQTHKWIDIP